MKWSPLLAVFLLSPLTALSAVVYSEYSNVVSVVVPTEQDIQVSFRPSPGTDVIITNGDLAGTASANNGRDFGSVLVGDTLMRDFIVENTGGSTLTVGIPQIGDTTNWWRSQVFTATLEPGQKSSFRVRFQPQSAGIFTTTVSLSSNDPDEDPFTFEVTGEGYTNDPDIQISYRPSPGVDVVITDGDLAGTADSNNGRDFGSVNVGDTLMRDFIVENNGQSTLTVGIPQIGDTTNWWRSQVFTATLDPGQKSSFRVRFQPMSAGVFTTTVSLTSNDPDEDPYTFEVTGEGVSTDPDIQISYRPSPGVTVIITDGDLAGTADSNNGRDFGAIDVGTTLMRDFIVDNTGTSTLTVGIPQIGDTTNWWRSQVFTATLGPGQKSSFRVRFQPATEGVFTTTVTVTSNDPDEDPYTFVVTGEGINGEPDIAIGYRPSPGVSVSIVDGDLAGTADSNNGRDFGSINVGDTLTRDFIVDNTGTATLTVGIPQIGDATNWWRTQLFNATLAPGQRSSFRVRFQPQAAGTFTTTISVTSDDPDESPYTFEVTGEGLGTEPDIQISYSPSPGVTVVITDGDLVGTADSNNGRDFGSVPVGDTLLRDFIVDNTGSTTLTVGIPQIGDTTNWWRSQVYTATLNPGQRSSFRVRFQPQSMGTFTTTVTLTSNDPDEDPFTFEVTGEGTAPPPTLTASIDPRKVMERSAPTLKQWITSTAIEAWLGKLEPRADGSFHHAALGTVFIDGYYDGNLVFWTSRSGWVATTASVWPLAWSQDSFFLAPTEPAVDRAYRNWFGPLVSVGDGVFAHDSIGELTIGDYHEGVLTFWSASVGWVATSGDAFPLCWSEDAFLMAPTDAAQTWTTVESR